MASTRVSCSGKTWKCSATCLIRKPRDQFEATNLKMALQDMMISKSQATNCSKYPGVHCHCC
jgi:hypothetical protein